MTTKFTADHEWINIEHHDAAVVGITLHAQDALGDVVYVDLPEVGRSYTQGEVAGVVESVKAASEVYAPVSGEIVGINDALTAEPAKVNADPSGEGWFFKVKLSNDIFMPVTGEVVAVNEALRENPALANSDPMGEGWFFKVKVTDQTQFDALMDPPGYDALLKTL